MRIWVTREADEGGHKALAFRSKKEAKKYVSEKLRGQEKEKKEWEEKATYDPWVNNLHFWREPELYIIKNKDDLIKCINSIANFQM